MLDLHILDMCIDIEYEENETYNASKTSSSEICINPNTYEKCNDED